MLDEYPWNQLRNSAYWNIFLFVEEHQVRNRLKNRKLRGGSTIEEIEAYYRCTDKPNVLKVLNNRLCADIELAWKMESGSERLEIVCHMNFQTTN